MNRATQKDVVRIGLSAAIVSVAEEEPRALVVHHSRSADALPFGQFDPVGHRTLEGGLRSWVNEQTETKLGYVEQLYTFGDRGRHQIEPGEARTVSVGYLALTRANAEPKATDTQWRSWYLYFPWEDWRRARPEIIDAAIIPALKTFAKRASGAEAELRRERARLAFGFDGPGWDEEKVLERYELLYEAGLVDETRRDGRPVEESAQQTFGVSMMFDHRRILATAIARLRGKMKYRPVVFELMAPQFTLLEFQRTVEAITGVRLHKQNFRRLVEDQGLVERTGKMARAARGRPAELFRFRREVVRERQAPGVRMGVRRSA